MVFLPEAHNNAMHGSVAFCFIAPLECAMGKLDVHAQALHLTPEHGHMFALGDAVGRNKGRTIGRLFQIPCCQDVPAADKVQNARAVYALHHRSQVGFLFLPLIAVT